MTIKARIAFGIAFLLSVIVALGLIINVYLQRIEESNIDIYEEQVVKLLNFENLTVLLNELSKDLLANNVNAFISDAQKLESAVVERVELIQLASETKNTQLDSLVEKAHQLAEDVRFFGKADGLDYAEQRAISLRIYEFGSLLHLAYTSSYKEVWNAYNDTRNMTRKAKNQMIIVGACCVLFASLVLVWLPGYVTNPIKTFSNSIKAIADGNFKTRLNVNRKDEFGALADSFNQMAVTLEAFSDQNIAEVIDSRNRLSVLVNNLDDLILGIDSERNIVFINKAMAEYLELSLEHAIGAYMPDIALKNAKVMALFEPIALGLKSASEPIEYYDTDGNKRFYQERLVRLTNERATNLMNNVSGYIIILSDITDFKEKTSRQNEFLAMLSHEMKTPIAAIKMSTALLEDERLGALDADQLELTKTITSNSKRLLKMVNEVLALSKTEQVGTQLHLTKVIIGELLSRAQKNLSSHAKQRSISFQTTIDPQMPPVELDQTRVVWVLNNLYSNAIRYAPKGSIISTDAIRVPGGIRISVSDQGPGIPAEERTRIFEKFTRVQNDTTKGTGLGLAISRDFIEAHGGRIFVDPTTTSGATIAFEIPFVIPAYLRNHDQSTSR